MTSQNQENVYYTTDYPEVFFTNAQKNYIQNIPQNQPKNVTSHKDLIAKFLPMLLGGNGAKSDIFSNLIQSKMGNNANLLSLLQGNDNLGELLNIFSKKDKPVSHSNEKKDIPTIIDMSNFKEIKD